MRRRGNYKLLGKFSYYTPGIGGMFALLFWLLVGAGIGSLLVLALGAVFGQNAVTEYGNLLSYPMMFIPPMLYASIKSNTAAMDKDGVLLDNNHFAPLGGAVCALLAAVGTLAIGFWTDALTSLLPEMPELLKEALLNLTNGNFLVNLLCVSIMAPFFEEWLCRGMVLRGLLSHKMNPALAIVISALFFAFIHLNPWQAVPAFLVGCLLGYIYYKTGSLKLTMLMHCVNNTLSLLVSRIPGWEDMESWSDVISGAPYWILIAATVLLTALVFLAFRKVTLQQSSGNLDRVPSIFSSDEV